MLEGGGGSQTLPPLCIARLPIFSPGGYFLETFRMKGPLMKDYSDSAMIALLPRQSNWAKVDLPHLTLVYAGKIADLKSSTFNEMAKDSSTLALLSSPQMLVTTGTEIFGDDEKVNVITLRPTQELLAMRSLVEKWNASEFPFRPHVTVGPVGTPIEHIPEFIFFDRVYLSYGEHNMTFKLTN